MRVAIDIRPALARGTGVGSFVEHLVPALDSPPGDHRLLLFTSSLKERWPPARLSGLQRAEVIDRKWPVRLLNLFWHNLVWPPVDRFVGPVDVAHSPSPLLMPAKNSTVVTLHDLYFLRRPEHTHGEIRKHYPKMVREHVHRADGVLAVSEATAGDAQEILGLPGDRIVVCGEDVSPVFDEPPTEEEMELSRRVAPEHFLLFVGTIEPRKNLPGLLRAFSIFQERYPEVSLVVAGPRGWGVDEFEAALEGIRDPTRVIVTGYLDPIAIRALYHRAIALVMPSLCEGFGLPLVEAMACGCPLVAAKNSALPEVAGDAALFWETGDLEELGELLFSVVEDRELRARLIESGRKQRRKFSWRRTAEIVLELYKEISGGGR